MFGNQSERCYGEATERQARRRTIREEIFAGIYCKLYFRRRVIAEWLNRFAWVSDYLWYNIVNSVVDIETVVTALIVLFALWCKRIIGAYRTRIRGVTVSSVGVSLYSNIVILIFLYFITSLYYFYRRS